MNSADFLQRVLSGGMVGAERYPLDATDTEVGPHVLRSWSDFADASDDQRVQAMASYILRVNRYEQGHILNMCTAIGTRQVTGVVAGRKMGRGRVADTREEFRDAIASLNAECARLYPEQT